MGVLPPTPDILAAAEDSARAVEAEVEAVELPAAINLIPFMSPIRNQAARGTCVSFALTALNEYILRRRGFIRDLSEQHLYYEIKLIDGAPAGCGTWQVRAVNALRVRGQCREQLWPYNPNPPCNNHGPRPFLARTDGLNYRLNTIAVSPRNVLSYKTHMSKQRPVTLSIPVYDSWYQSAETRRSGRITMRIGNEPAVGGHAVCLVGYQDTPNSPGGGFFIVRNSWVPWATQSPYGAGYGTIPYQYITNDGWEAFTAVVPGITVEEEEEDTEQLETGKGTVTIEVGSNIKITISST
jgi:C1A family cysteine protease